MGLKLTVLILIVVDNGLVHSESKVVYGNVSVLILIVVDNGLVLRVILNKWWIPSSLNPCCSGRWSRTGRG